MTSRTYATLLPALLLAFCALASVGSAKTISALPIQNDLKYVPSICYKRSQFCCFKFEKCGEDCKPYNCTTKRVCAKKNIFKRCIRHKNVQVCDKRCYTKYCPRFSCSPLLKVNTLGYKAPTPVKLSKTFVTKTK